MISPVSEPVRSGRFSRRKRWLAVVLDRTWHSSGEHEGPDRTRDQGGEQRHNDDSREREQFSGDPPSTRKFSNAHTDRSLVIGLNDWPPIFNDENGRVRLRGALSRSDPDRAGVRDSLARKQGAVSCCDASFD